MYILIYVVVMERKREHCIKYDTQVTHNACTIHTILHTTANASSVI